MASLIDPVSNGTLGSDASGISSAMSERGLSPVELKLKSVLESLLRDIRDNPHKPIYEADLLPFLYTSKKGSELAERIFGGEDTTYSQPRREFRFIEDNKDNFSRTVVPGAVHVSAGNGPYIPVIRKDLVMNDAFDSDGYVSIDIDEYQAQHGAQVIGVKTGKPSNFLSINFMEPFNLREAMVGDRPIGDRPLMITALGGIGGNIDLYRFLTNMSEATQGKALMIMIMGAMKTPRVSNEYMGEAMREFMQALWPYAGRVLTHGARRSIKTFNPDAFMPIERYDAKEVAAAHDVLVSEDTFAPVDDRWIKIPQGRIIRTGLSRQVDVADIAPQIARAGWHTINAPLARFVPAIEAVVIAAPYTPPEWSPIWEQSLREAAIRSEVTVSARALSVGHRGSREFPTRAPSSLRGLSTTLLEEPIRWAQADWTPPMPGVR